MQPHSENKSRERTFGGLWYCPTRNHVVDSTNKALVLRPKTLDVFRYLSEHPDTVVSRSELLDAIWPDSHVTEDSLTQCVSEIRKLYKADATNILRTVPKRGYQLNSDHIDIDSALESASTESGPAPAAWNHRKSLLAVLATLLFGSVIVYQVGLIDSDDGTETSPSVEESQSAISTSVDQDQSSQSNVNHTDPNLSAPSVLLKVHLGSESSDIDAVLLQDALRLSMGRYKTIQLVEKGEADFSLEVGVRADADDQPYVMMILKDTVQGFEVLAERIDPAPGEVSTSRLASRIAAMIASPATGAVGRRILQSSRSKPVQELTRAECYAHGYDCTNCSGELDTVDTRAQSCLASILEKDNEDVRAWGLQSTIYAKQYQWSTNLGEPLRTDVRLREPIVDKAIAAANRAEQLSDGTDSAVYWGMAQAYQSACDIPKMQTAMQRGLQINPEDPGMLGTFGNWLAYSGEWDAGTEMVSKAIAIEPKHYKRWWLFAPAKRHYIRGEFEQALDYFEQAFNERNWLSHLQMAYTLPFLDRHEEARVAAKKLQFMFPGVTIEVALQLYSLYCFPEDYLSQMKKGLQMAGLPERGDSSDLSNIQVPKTHIVKLDDWEVEYRDVGSGQPVVFVHGSMSDYRTWLHYQNPVSEKHRFVSYSRRYYGSQPWQDQGERDTPQQHAKDLEGFLEHLDTGPVVLVSWSSGTSIATLLALKRPDLVSGMVLYEPNTLQLDDPTDADYPEAEKEQFLGTFKRIFDYLEAGKTELATKAFLESAFESQPGEFETELMWIRRVVLDSVATVPLRLANETTEPNQQIVCEDLASLETPISVLVGELTNEYWQYRARKFVECAPNASLSSIAGVNHAGPIRVPGLVFEYIENLIDQL